MPQPTQEEYDRYIREIEGQLDVEKQRSGDLAKANYGQMNLFNQENEENLIRWQLDLKEDLERLYHLLKGDVLKEDKEGNVLYTPPDNPDLRPLNEFGVQIIMNIMQFYLNRNTILSNYDLKTIEWKILDFGIELSDLLFNRYDEMMVTIEKEEDETEEEWDDRYRLHISSKLKLYPMLIKELVDTVHSAYLRAYNGGERESLRTARTVTQTEPMYRNQHGGAPQVQSVSNKRKWYNPLG